MGNARNLLRKIVGRNVVLKRRLPKDFGRRTVYVTPASALGVLKPDLEKFAPRLFDSVRSIVKKNDVVWDIGANMGLFAFAAAHRAGSEGHVVSVEADPSVAALMHRTERKYPDQQSAPLEVFCAAIWDNIGVQRLCVTPDMGQQHLESATSKVSFNHTFPVPTVTLDWMLDHFPAPTALKADIEGAEYEMFLGAPKLLSEVRPRMVVEVKPSNSKRVGELLRSYNYVLYDAEDLQRGEVGQCAYECLALPEEQKLNQEELHLSPNT